MIFKSAILFVDCVRSLRPLALNRVAFCSRIMMKCVDKKNPLGLVMNSNSAHLINNQEMQLLVMKIDVNFSRILKFY